MRGLVVALLVAGGLGRAAAMPGGGRGGLPLGATPDPGTHAARKHELTEHPSLRPNAPRPMSQAAITRMVTRQLAYHASRGLRPSRDAHLVGEATETWSRLRPAILARYGVDLPPNLRVLAGGRRGFVATALPDGSIVVNRSALELARTLARAVAAADGDPDRLLANLQVVVRGMRQDRYRLSFGRVDARRYRAALDGALIGLIGHELGHVTMRHAATDISTRSRTLRNPADLDRRIRAYFGVKNVRRVGASGQDFVDGRPLFYSQDQEADADRIAIDLANDVGASPDGLVADLLAYTILDGLERPPVTSHPPSVYRFDDGRRRYRQAGIPTIADGITRKDLRKAIAGSR